MVFIIGLLTLVMILNCFVLIFLVLLQLPKKDAGAGLAFGGAATDALFGAGSGNVLTKITKYLAGSFFFLSVLIALLRGYHYGKGTSTFRNLLASPGSRPPATAPAAHTTPVQPGPAPGAGSNLLMSAPSSGSNLLLTVPSAEATNLPAKPAPAPAPAPATNKPAAPSTPK